MGISKKIILLVLIISGLTAGIAVAYKSYKYRKEAVPVAVDITQIQAQQRQESVALQNVDQVLPRSSESPAIPTEPLLQDTETVAAPQKTSVDATSAEPEKLPSELNLKVAFYSQAPFGNWDYPWQEACEEASVLLVANEYFNHQWTAEQFRDEILKLVEWEKAQYGDYQHTTVDQTAEILNDYLGLKTITHENPSFEDIQKILAKGHLVVMTFAGKQLFNPNYKNGGPIYHAMVAKGYKGGGGDDASSNLQQKLIMHDVGTRRGEDYVYLWNTLQKALHDYAEPIENGPKRIIEVLPPL